MTKPHLKAIDLIGELLEWTFQDSGKCDDLLETGNYTKKELNHAYDLMWNLLTEEQEHATIKRKQRSNQMQNKENALLFKELEELQEQNHKDYGLLEEQRLTISYLKEEVEYLTKKLEKAKIDSFMEDNGAKY